MKKLQLKKEVVVSLERGTMQNLKGGAASKTLECQTEINPCLGSVFGHCIQTNDCEGTMKCPFTKDYNCNPTTDCNPVSGLPNCNIGHITDKCLR
ncbi:class I lanthipeptide [uncultured Alistipes sp.]|uniref:class I lanthipeptide n=1 Tax=uncultured Alistipes sp. TaxID=538949 RepID=UPI00266F03E2|nr:class I lanthipeptide [uncultured Alistipes sp.]